MFYLLLKPSTMEDEGRSHLIGSFPSKEAAIAERDRQVAASEGWYTAGSFAVAQVIA